MDAMLGLYAKQASKGEDRPRISHVWNAVILPTGYDAETQFPARSLVKEIQHPSELPSMVEGPIRNDIGGVARLAIASDASPGMLGRLQHLFF